VRNTVYGHTSVAGSAQRAKMEGVAPSRRIRGNLTAGTRPASAGGQEQIALPAPALRRSFRRKLLVWYRRNGRDLPWRKTSDPYHVLVSEIMLQQTQVDRVLPKYAEWLSKFPTLADLASAPVEDVVGTWYPLGYNIRPRRLHGIAREAVARYGGELPADPTALRSFKGIGPYTEGAILSFAFGKRAAILDTNVARVLFRIFVGRGDPKAHRVRRALWRLSDALVPARDVFDFNQGLMDLGAVVCVARNPRCLVCPMTTICRAFPFNPEHEATTRIRRLRPGERGNER
jgi:A/G-specific adenine glycosylase